MIVFVDSCLLILLFLTIDLLFIFSDFFGFSLLYVNDLHHASKVLNPIMFADDTNLFFSHSDINILFEKMNKELTNVSNWFNANKLSLNVKKAKFSFFHKPSKKDNTPLRLPNLNINGFTIERESSIKFL